MHKIVIVDDEAEIVEAIKNFLENKGYAVFTASDGDQAQETIIKADPDVILLDLIMPKTNGFEVLEWLRKNVKRRIPVIILSIKDKLGDIKKGYSCDADFYLPKPFTNQDLLRGITTVLSLAPFRKE
jgi:DNA-binding response OmpR family regulator